VPNGLHTKLVANAQYKLDFADRVHRHYGRSGRSVDAAGDYCAVAKVAGDHGQPIVGESARWGITDATSTSIRTALTFSTPGESMAR
jgi:hypothetical protein